MSKQLCSRLQKKTLTLEEKIRVLDHAEKNPKAGCRKLTKLFSVGKRRSVKPSARPTTRDREMVNIKK